jgi:hemolysin activation/secretion protein
MFMRHLIVVNAVLAAMSMVALAQATKQPDAGASRTTNQEGHDQEMQGQKPDETLTQHQATPQASAGPTETTSGGMPAASPQGDAPAGMQATPPESPEKNMPGVPSGH